ELCERSPREWRWRNAPRTGWPDWMRTFQTGILFDRHYISSRLRRPCDCCAASSRTLPQQYVESVRKGLAVRGRERRRPARVDTGATQRVHEVAQVEQLADVLGGEAFAARRQADGALGHDLGC